ncbi:MAG: formate/nitrite transporter family protein [Veillonella sp.]|nr:formate/nitrite transporter family protein [Veillonella sp.]
MLECEKQVVAEDEIIKHFDTIHLSPKDKVVVEEHERLSQHLIYEIIRRDGIEELLRPYKSLFLSGVGAGILVSFSFICMAILQSFLPNQPWAPLITKWGYTVGFVLVILCRAQLFTENTITTVIPLFKPFTWPKFWGVVRLWHLVLAGNLLGTTLVAWFLTTPGLMNLEYVVQLGKIAEHVSHFTWYENLVRGIPSGILIAAIVWMMPTARQYALLLVAFFTYFIAAGDFTHIVVGSCEMMYAVITGHASIVDYIVKFILPVGLGNIIGGTGVFTMLGYRTIDDELQEK